MVPVYWPEDIYVRIGTLETLTAVGLMMGPLLGGGLYYFFGYAATFYSNNIRIYTKIQYNLVKKNIFKLKNRNYIDSLIKK